MLVLLVLCDLIMSCFSFYGFFMSVYVHAQCPAWHKYCFSCGLFAASCVLTLLACVFMHFSPAQCASFSAAGSLRPPASPARCVCICSSQHVCVCVCLWERVRQACPMDSLLSRRKADYGTCQGVRNTPYQYYTDSQLSTHLCGCNCKPLALLPPPAIWEQCPVFLQQPDMKLDSQ